MASTNILISSDNSRTATPNQVFFGAGDSVTIRAAEDAPSILAFSPATQSILDPNPGQRITVESGAAHSFTFKSAEPGIYSIAVADAQSTRLVGTEDIGADKAEVGASAPTLKLHVIRMEPSPLSPPPRPESGPTFHPNSGG